MSNVTNFEQLAWLEGSLLSPSHLESGRAQAAGHHGDGAAAWTPTGCGIKKQSPKKN